MKHECVELIYLPVVVTYIAFWVSAIWVMDIHYKDELFWKINLPDRLYRLSMSTLIERKPKLYTRGFLWQISYWGSNKLRFDMIEEFRYKYWVDVTDPTQLPVDSKGVIIELEIQFADDETKRLYRTHEQTIDLQSDENTIVTFEKTQSFDSICFGYGYVCTEDEHSRIKKAISFFIHLVFIVFAVSPLYHVITKFINWKTFERIFFKRVVIKKIISSIQAPVHENKEEASS